MGGILLIVHLTDIRPQPTRSLTPNPSLTAIAVSFQWIRAKLTNQGSLTLEATALGSVRRRPLRAAEHVVIDGEIAVLPNLRDVGSGGHGALTGIKVSLTTKGWALRQVLGSNRCPKGSIRVTMTVGRVCMLDLL